MRSMDTVYKCHTDIFCNIITSILYLDTYLQHPMIEFIEPKPYFSDINRAHVLKLSKQSTYTICYVSHLLEAIL